MSTGDVVCSYDNYRFSKAANWDLILLVNSLKWTMFLLFQDNDGDSVLQDLAVQRTKIYTITANTSERPDDDGIVAESSDWSGQLYL